MRQREVPDQDVGRLDVQVDDLVMVKVFQAACNLGGRERGREGVGEGGKEGGREGGRGGR